MTEAAGPEVVTVEAGTRWRIGRCEFVSSYAPDSSVDLFAIRKPARLVDKYVRLAHEFGHAKIVELGIAAGGSTAFLALLAEPEKLVACELASEPIAALTELIEREQLTASIRPHYGVNQADRAALENIMGREFGDTDVDLVIDDASHLYDETKASFEVLFPHVRPGGLFIIEDWGADYARHAMVAAALEDPSSETRAKFEANWVGTPEPASPEKGPFPLHRIAVELIQVCFHRRDVIAEVAVDSDWITVRRGDAELDRRDFRIADYYHHDRWHWVLP